MPRPNSDREITILTLHYRGETHASIARRVGVTPARVSQVIKMHRELPPPVPHAEIGPETHVDALPGLTGRELNCLERAGIRTVGDLAKLTDEVMLGWPGCGKISVARIREALSGLSFLEKIKKTLGLFVFLCCALATLTYPWVRHILSEI